MAKCQTIKKAFHPQRDEKPWYHPNSEDKKNFIILRSFLDNGAFPPAASTQNPSRQRLQGELQPASTAMLTAHDIALWKLLASLLSFSSAKFAHDFPINLLSLSYFILQFR